MWKGTYSFFWSYISSYVGICIYAYICVCVYIFIRINICECIVRVYVCMYMYVHFLFESFFGLFKVIVHALFV